MMENLSIADSGPRGPAPPQQQQQHQQHQQHQQQQPHQQQQQQQGGVPPQPAAPQQLPPQMFTTAAQLLDLTDKKLMVALRDGRKFIGVLRSWDQFANLVLQSTVERIFVPAPAGSAPGPGAAVGLYADIPRGIFLVRGENVLLLGEIDLDKDDDPPAGYELADAERVQRLARERGEAEKARGKARIGRLNAIGFEGEHMGDILL